MKKKSIKASLIACVLLTLTTNIMPAVATSYDMDWDNTNEYSGSKDNSSCVYVYNKTENTAIVNLCGYKQVGNPTFPLKRDAGTWYHYKWNGRNYVYAEDKIYNTTNLYIPAEKECLIYNMLYESNVNIAYISTRPADKKKTVYGKWSPDSVKEYGHTYKYLPRTY